MAQVDIKDKCDVCGEAAVFSQPRPGGVTIHRCKECPMPDFAALDRKEQRRIRQDLALKKLGLL